MINIFLKKSYTKCGGETIPRAFFLKKSKLSISLDQLSKVLYSLFFIVCQNEDYQNILKLSCRRHFFTSYNAFLKKLRCLELASLPHFLMIFEEKYFWSYILLPDQISLSDSLYFVRYWAICVLQLFFYQFVTPWILKLTLPFWSNRFSTWPKSQDKNLNILTTKRVFNVK